MKKVFNVRFIMECIIRFVGMLIGMIVFTVAGIASFDYDIRLLMGIISIAGLVFSVFAVLYKPNED